MTYSCLACCHILTPLLCHPCHLPFLHKGLAHWATIISKQTCCWLVSTDVPDRMISRIDKVLRERWVPKHKEGRKTYSMSPLVPLLPPCPCFTLLLPELPIRQIGWWKACLLDDNTLQHAKIAICCHLKERVRLCSRCRWAMWVNEKDLPYLVNVPPFCLCHPYHLFTLHLLALYACLWDENMTSQCKRPVLPGT